MKTSVAKQTKQISAPLTKIVRPVFKTIVDENALPKLIIPKAILHEIEYLNSKNKNREWSGVLFYTIENGSINDVKNLTLLAKGIFLKDIGTAGSTNYEFSGDVVEYMDMRAKELGVEPLDIYSKWKIGHHHSHHNLHVTPSVTDKEEIEDNIKNHVAYLTTITNNNLDISAFLSIYSKIESKNTFVIKDHDNEEHTAVSESFADGILKYKVKVEWEEKMSVSDAFIKRYAELDKPVSVLKNSHANSLYDDYYGNWETPSLFDQTEADYKSLKKRLETEEQNGFDSDFEIDFEIMTLIDIIMHDEKPSCYQNIATVEQALTFVERKLTTPYEKTMYFNGLQQVIEIEDDEIMIRDMLDLLDDEHSPFAFEIRSRILKHLSSISKPKNHSIFKN